MQTLRFSKHHDVEMYEFGYAPIGKPVMTVYCYFVDGLLIDTAQANAERKVQATFAKKDIHQIALTTGTKTTPAILLPWPICIAPKYMRIPLLGIR